MSCLKGIAILILIGPTKSQFVMVNPILNLTKTHKERSLHSMMSVHLLGENVEFKGTINYKGTVRIDGRLTGEIHTEGTLIVGQSASVEAKVVAGIVVCQGKLVGDIVAREKIQLMSPAVLDGSVKTPSLSMEEGVLFNGTCAMSSKSEEEASTSSFSSEAVSEIF